MLKVKRSQKTSLKGFSSKIQGKIESGICLLIFLRTDLMKNTFWTLLTFTDFSEKWNGVTNFLTVSCVFEVTESSLFLKTFLQSERMTFAKWKMNYSTTCTVSDFYLFLSFLDPLSPHSAARMPISSQIFRCSLELGRYITF